MKTYNMGAFGAPPHPRAESAGNDNQPAALDLSGHDLSSPLTPEELGNLPERVRTEGALEPLPEGSRNEWQMSICVSMAYAGVPDSLHYRALFDTQNLPRLANAIMIKDGRPRPSSAQYARDQIRKAKEYVAAHPKKAEEPATKFEWQSLLPVDSSEIVPRDWVVPGLIERSQVTIFAGHGGSTKSLLGLSLAMACVSGHKFGPWEPRKRSDGRLMRVALVNLEDDFTEQQRRLAAILETGAFCKVDQTKLSENLFTVKLDGLKLVAKSDGGVKQTQAFMALLESLRSLDVDLVIFDPLAEFSFGLDENSAEMHELHRAFRYIARHLHVAVCVVHHFNKSGTASNQNSFRGSTTLGAGARLVLNVERMSEQDAATFGIAEDNRSNFIKTVVAKANYTAGGVTHWFRTREIMLGNGEKSVGLEPTSPAELEGFGAVSNETKQKILDVIERGLPDGGRYTAATRGPKDTRADVMIADEFKLPPKKAKQVLRLLIDNGNLKPEDTRSGKSNRSVPGLRVVSRKVEEPEIPF